MFFGLCVWSEGGYLFGICWFPWGIENCVNVSLHGCHSFLSFLKIYLLVYPFVALMFDVSAFTVEEPEGLGY